MPLIDTSHDSLPYIDTPPTTAGLAAAQALIEADLQTDSSSSSTHPLLPPLPPENYSPLMQAEFARIANGLPAARGIDLARYEALSAPNARAAYRPLLAQTYASATFLSSRAACLARLDAVGRDKWLAGNEALVSVLDRLERELAATKEAIDLVVVERRSAQEAVSGELALLEKSWREGVGRVLETEVAANELRSRILEARRRGAA